MTSVFARLCFAAAIAFGAIGVGMSAPAVAQVQVQAQAADWSDEEIAELEAILRDALVPMLNDMNAAIQTADTDRPGACTLANSAATRFAEADRRLTALYAKVKSEGRDISRFEPVMAKMQDLRERLPEIVDQICRGDMGHSDDPKLEAIRVKVMGLLRRYSDDMTAATNANAAGDTVKACLSLKDGLAALDELDAYMHEILKTYGATPADAAEMQKVFVQIQQWRVQTQAAARDCPAS